MLAGSPVPASKSRLALSRASPSSTPCATPHRPLFRMRHVGLLRAKGVLQRRSRRRVGASRRHRASRGRGEATRAPLDGRACGGRRPSLRGRRAGRALRESGRWRQLGAQQAVLGSTDTPRLEPRSRRHVHALHRDVAGRSVESRARHIGGRRVAHGRRRPDVAPREQGDVSALHAGGGARGDDHALRPQHAPRPEAARAALHAVPRRRLPLRRRR